jgi:hypothetical protein
MEHKQRQALATTARLSFRLSPTEFPSSAALALEKEAARIVASDT